MTKYLSVILLLVLLIFSLEIAAGQCIPWADIYSDPPDPRDLIPDPEKSRKLHEEMAKYEDKWWVRQPLLTVFIGGVGVWLIIVIYKRVR